MITRRDQLVDQRSSEKKRLRQTDLKAVLDSLQRTIDQLSEEVELSETLIEQAVQSNPRFKQKNQLLQTIPGISKTIAPIIIALLGEAGKTAKVALIAIARKIITIINAMFKTGMVYQ